MNNSELESEVSEQENTETSPLLAKRGGRSRRSFADMAKSKFFRQWSWIGFLVLARSLNNVLWKRTAAALTSYAFLISLLQAVTYVPIFWSVVIVRRWMGLYKVSDDEKKFKHKKFVIAGILTQSYTILLVAGSCTAISGPVMVLLMQLGLPFTVILSLVILKSKYLPAHYIGVGIILGGILESTWPALRVPAAGTGPGGGSVVYGVILFVVGGWFVAGYSVYMEKAFADAGDIDLYWMQAWMVTYQSAFAFMLSPLSLVVQQTPFSEAVQLLVSGLQCIFLGTPQPGNTCPGAMAWFIFYQFFNVCYNLGLLAIIKVGSATLSAVASTITIPISNLLFTIPLLMGTLVISLSIYDIAALMMVACGMGIYRYADHIQAKKKREGELVRERDRIINE